MRRLAQSEFVAGPRYSIADITTLIAVDFARWAKLPVPEECTHLRRWHAAGFGAAKRQGLSVQAHRRNSQSDIQAVLGWLAGGALSGAQFAGRAGGIMRSAWSTCGIPLWRVAVFVTTLHPDVMGRRFLWQASSGVTTSDALFDILETDDYRKSPFTTVYATREPIRRRLADPDCPIDFAILDDLRAEGVTDYAAFPLLFTDGTVHVATWSTQAPGGFSPASSLPTLNRLSRRWRGSRKFARCGAPPAI